MDVVDDDGDEMVMIVVMTIISVIIVIMTILKLDHPAPPSTSIRYTPLFSGC